MAEDHIPVRDGLSADSECPYGCPVCAGIALVQQMQPDVTTHLGAAAREFMQAAKAFLDSITEPRPQGNSSKVERIPLE